MSSLKLWPETQHTYARHLRDAYRKGELFGEWHSQYACDGHLLFCEHMLQSEQIPHSGPVKDAALGFHELFMGTRYLDAGFEATFSYRQVEDQRSYDKLCELVGGAAAGAFISPNGESGGKPPDLLVFEPSSGCFLFVECKGPREPLTKSQPSRFAQIEAYLNQNLDWRRSALLTSGSADSSLFPPLSPGKWIHIARLSPG